MPTKNSSAWQESRTHALSTPAHLRTHKQRLHADHTAAENRRLLSKMISENDISRKARVKYLGFDGVRPTASLTMGARKMEARRINRENKYMIERIGKSAGHIDTGDSVLSRSRSASRQGSPAKGASRSGSKRANRPGSKTGAARSSARGASPTSFTKQRGDSRGSGVEVEVQLPIELRGGGVRPWGARDPKPLRPGSRQMLSSLTARTVAFEAAVERAFLSDSDSDDGRAAMKEADADPFAEENARRDVMASKARVRQRAKAHAELLQTARFQHASRSSMPKLKLSRFETLQAMSNGNGSSHFRGFPPHLQSSGIMGGAGGGGLQGDDMAELKNQLAMREVDEDDFEDALDRADEDPDADKGAESAAFIDIEEDARSKREVFPIIVKKVLMGRVKPAKGTMMVMSRRNCKYLLKAMRLSILFVRIQVRGASTILRSATRRREAQVPENKRKEYDATHEATRARMFRVFVGENGALAALRDSIVRHSNHGRLAMTVFQAYCALLIDCPENVERSLSMESVDGDNSLWAPMVNAMSQTTGNAAVQRWGCHAFATIPIPNIEPIESTAATVPSPSRSPRRASTRARRESIKAGGRKMGKAVGGVGSALANIAAATVAIASIRPGGRKVSASGALRAATYARRMKVSAILTALEHHAPVSGVVIAASDALDVSIEGLLDEFALRYAVAAKNARASGGAPPRENSTAWCHSWLLDQDAAQLNPQPASRPYCRAILGIAALIRAEMYDDQLESRKATAKLELSHHVVAASGSLADAAAAAAAVSAPAGHAEVHTSHIDPVVTRQMNLSALALLNLCVACPNATRAKGATGSSRRATSAHAKEMVDVAAAIEDGLRAVVELMKVYLHHGDDLVVSCVRMLASAVQCPGWRQQPRTLRQAATFVKIAFDAALVAANESPDDAELQLHAARVFSRCVAACTAGERTHRVTDEAVAKSKTSFQTWAMKEAGRGWSESTRGLPKGGPFGVLVRAMIPASKRRWVSRLFSTIRIHRDDIIELELATRRGTGIGIEMCKAMFLLADAHAVNAMKARNVGALDAVRAIVHRHHARETVVGEWGCAALDALVRDHDNGVMNKLAASLGGGVEEQQGFLAITDAAGGAAPSQSASKTKAVKPPDFVERARVKVKDKTNMSAVEAGELGVVELVIKVMKTHPHHAQLQLLGCGALDSLCHECKKNQARAGRAAVLTHLVYVLRKHQGKADLVQQACGALCRIAANDEVWPFVAYSEKDVMSRPMSTLSKGEVAQLLALAKLTLGTGPAEAVVAAMKRHARKDVVQYWGCAAIFSLVFPSPLAKQRAGEAGVTHALRDVLDKYMDNRVILCQAFRSCHCISMGSTAAQEIAVFGVVDKRGKRTWRDGGIIPRCVRVMRYHPNDEQLLIDANRALYGCIHANRVTQFEGSRLLRIQGGPGGIKGSDSLSSDGFKGVSALDTVVDVLDRHPGKAKLQLWCLKAIECIVGGEHQVRVRALPRFVLLRFDATGVRAAAALPARLLRLCGHTVPRRPFLHPSLSHPPSFLSRHQDSEKEGERLRYEETLTPAERATAAVERKKHLSKIRAKALSERRQIAVPVRDLEVAYSKHMRCKVRKDRLHVAEAITVSGARFISRADIQHIVRMIKGHLGGSVPPKRFR